MSAVEPRGETSAVVELVARVGENRMHLAVAESLTGGLLCAEIVGVPGASAVFSGGIIAYDTELKHELLSVDDELLALHGPVHELVATQMAQGVRLACGVTDADTGEFWQADLGLATTGVAGPDPDPQTGLAAGTVWIAVSSSRGSRAVLVPHLEGADRQTIRERTVDAAIKLALQELVEMS